MMKYILALAVLGLLKGVVARDSSQTQYGLGPWEENEDDLEDFGADFLTWWQGDNN